MTKIVRVTVALEVPDNAVKVSDIVALALQSYLEEGQQWKVKGVFG